MTVKKKKRRAAKEALRQIMERELGAGLAMGRVEGFRAAERYYQIEHPMDNPQATLEYVENQEEPHEEEAVPKKGHKKK